MEKDNKYYSLIETLVKNHRKYPGHETILDEIVSDVYKHSKTVIESIHNDEVIQSYLQKVVSTSMITVPKRLNFHNELKHRDISVQMQASKENEAPLQEYKEPENCEVSLTDSDSITDIRIESTEQVCSQLTESDEQKEFVQDTPVKANPEFVDKMINSLDVNSIMENNPEQKIEDELQVADREIVEEKISNEDFLSLDLDEDFSDIETVDNQYDINDENIENISETQVNTIEELNDDVQPFEESGYIYGNNEHTDILQTEEIELESTLQQTETDIAGIEPEVEEVQLSEECEDDININNESEEQILKEGTNELELIEDVEDAGNDVFLEGEEQELDFNNIETLETEEGVEEADNDVFAEDEEQELDFNNIETLETEEGVEDADNDVFAEDEEQEQDFDNIETLETEEDIEDDASSFELIQDNSLEAVNENSLDTNEDIYDLTVGLEGNGENAFLDTDETNELIEQNELSDIDNNDVMLEYTEEEPLITENNNKSELPISYRPVNYTTFNYIPHQTNFDVNTDKIVNSLININNERPELKILEVFELKYKKCFSIEKIAEELDIEKQDVIRALDEIVDLI